MNNHDFGKLLKETGIVTAINLGAALFAFGKDILLASYFGTTKAADLFWLAFFIPDTIGYNLLFPAITLSAVPFLARLFQQKNHHDFARFISGYTWAGNLLALLVIMAIVVSENLLIQSLLPGAAGGAVKYFHILLMIMLPVILWGVWLGTSNAVLQSCEFFRPIVCAPLFTNGLLFVGLLFLGRLAVPPSQGAYWIAMLYCGGTACAAFFLWMVIGGFARQGKLPSPRFQSGVVLSVTQKAFGIFWPYLLILCGYQGVLLFERYLASRLPAGNIAALNYAYRLSQFPVWVFGAAFVLVILPALTKEIGDAVRFRALSLQAFFWSLFIGLPLACGFFLLREPLVATLFRRGAFNAQSLRMTTEILAGYSLTIPSQLLILMAWRVFLAQRRMIGPLLSSFGAMIVNILFDWLMLPVFHGATLGYGAALGCFVNSISLLVGILRVTAPKIGQAAFVSRVDILKVLFKVFVVAGIWFWLAFVGWPLFRSWQNAIVNWIFLGLTFGGLALIYWFCGKNAWRRWLLETDVI